MPVAMSKNKQTAREPAEPPADKIVTVRVPNDLFTAFEQYRAAQLYPPDRTAVILRLMEQFLRAEGFAVPPRRPASS